MLADPAGILVPMTPHPPEVAGVQHRFRLLDARAWTRSLMVSSMRFTKITVSGPLTPLMFRRSGYAHP